MRAVHALYTDEFTTILRAWHFCWHKIAVPNNCHTTTDNEIYLLITRVCVCDWLWYRWWQEILCLTTVKFYSSSSRSVIIRSRRFRRCVVIILISCMVRIFKKKCSISRLPVNNNIYFICMKILIVIILFWNKTGDNNIMTITIKDGKVYTY